MPIMGFVEFAARYPQCILEPHYLTAEHQLQGTLPDGVYVVEYHYYTHTQHGSQIRVHVHCQPKEEHIVKYSGPFQYYEMAPKWDHEVHRFGLCAVCGGLLARCLITGGLAVLYYRYPHYRPQLFPVLTHPAAA